MKLVPSFLICALLLGGSVSLADEFASIKMKVAAANPSKTKTQVARVKAYFPKEITMKDIRETGGLDIEYDDEQGVYYAYKDVALAPSETKVFELIMSDVWNIPEEELARQKERTDKVMKELEKSEYLTSAEFLSKTIYSRLEEIIETQTDPNASRQQHIAYYRDNLKSLALVKEDIERLEKLLVSLGGAPSAELLQKAGSNVKAPSMKTTWGVIFALIIFVGILSSVFYFTWLRQGRIAENIFTKEQESAFGDLKDRAPSERPKEPDP